MPSTRRNTYSTRSVPKCRLHPLVGNGESKEDAADGNRIKLVLPVLSRDQCVYNASKPADVSHVWYVCLIPESPSETGSKPFLSNDIDRQYVDNERRGQ